MLIDIEELDPERWYSISEINAVLGLNTKNARITFAKHEKEIDSGHFIPLIRKNGVRWQILGKAVKLFLEIIKKEKPKFQ